MGTFDWMHQFSLDSSLTLFFDFVVYTMHIKVMQQLWHTWQLFVIIVCCSVSHFHDALVFVVILVVANLVVWILHKKHMFLCFYSFYGVVELHEWTQQWNNGGDKAFEGNGANNFFEGWMAKGGLACAITSMRWIFSQIVWCHKRGVVKINAELFDNFFRSYITLTFFFWIEVFYRSQGYGPWRLIMI